MKMTYNPKLKRWEVTTTYQEYVSGYTEKIKQAGFRFEKKPNPLWWTDVPEVASLITACADDTAQAMLSQRAEARDQALAESRATEATLANTDCRLSVEPYPFQRAGIAYALSRKRVIFGDEPGCGKTIQALGTVHTLALYPCIAVVPATLKHNWRVEARRCVPELTDDNIHTLYTTTPTDIDPGAKLIVINYDILGAWLPMLTSVGAQSLIVDESHFAKNSNSQRTKALAKLARGIPYRYLLSGTPVPNRPVELESQLKILGVLDLFGGSNEFRFRYCGPTKKWYYARGVKLPPARYRKNGGQRFAWEFKGATNLEELQRRLREHVLVRRLKSEVLADLPPKRHQCIEIPNRDLPLFAEREEQLIAQHAQSIAELKTLRKMASDSGNQTSFEAASADLRRQYSTHFANMAKLSHDVAMAKVPFVIQYCLEVLESEEKLAVAAHHHDVEDALIQAFRKANIHTVAVTGRETEVQKNKAVQDFQHGDARVFIAGLKCGIGYTITAASRMVMAEMDWTPGVMDQTSDRIHRIGQRDSVLITYITLENSLDSRKVGMLNDKRRVAQDTLDTVFDWNTIPTEEQPHENTKG